MLETVQWRATMMSAQQDNRARRAVKLDAKLAPLVHHLAVPRRGDCRRAESLHPAGPARLRPPPPSKQPRGRLRREPITSSPAPPSQKHESEIKKRPFVSSIDTQHGPVPPPPPSPRRLDQSAPASTTSSCRGACTTTTPVPSTACFVDYASFPRYPGAQSDPCLFPGAMRA